MPELSAVDHLPLVLTRVRRCGRDGADAEDTALRILLQFHRRSGPSWLLRTDDRTRLDVLTALALVRSDPCSSGAERRSR